MPFPECQISRARSILWSARTNVLQRLLQNSAGYEHQKLRVVGQVVDERLTMWSTVGSTVTKDLFRIAASNIEETIVCKCHSCRTIKPGGLWFYKEIRGALPKIVSQNRVLPAASNEKITTVWAEQQMDRPIKLMALRTKISQMATRASFVNPYAIGST